MPRPTPEHFAPTGISFHWHEQLAEWDAEDQAQVEEELEAQSGDQQIERTRTITATILAFPKTTQ